MEKKEPAGTVTKGSKSAELLKKVKRMTLAEHLVAHGALIRHLEFSPDGKFFVTSRYVLEEESTKI
jgi:WD repeat-containing protein 26